MTAPKLTNAGAPVPRAQILPPIDTISTPPPRPGPYRALATPSEEQQIRALSLLAARNHRSLPRTHPARSASQDLASLLHLLLARGVPAQELATLFTPPITHQAVRARAAAARPAPAPLPPPLTTTNDAPPTHYVKYRSDAPASTSLITTAPYRRIRLLASPYPIPPAPLPVFYPPNEDTSQQLLQWLSSPQRTPGAAYADNNLIRLHLTPVTADDERSDTEKKKKKGPPQ